MANIQKRLNSLQPYVIGIRYLKTIPIVDAIFKEGWNVPESDVILKEKQEGEENYYMFFTQKEGIGIDELLDYVEKIIKMNIEREKKHALLKTKVKELQVLFSKTPLTKLNNMRFVLGGEELIPEVMPSNFDDISLDESVDLPVTQPQVESNVEMQKDSQKEVTYEPKDPEEMTDVAPEAEIVGGVEPSSDWDNDINNTANAQGQKIELPPREQKNAAPELEDFNEPDIVCKCGPDDMCPVCIEEKTMV